MVNTGAVSIDPDQTVCPVAPDPSLHYLPSSMFGIGNMESVIKMLRVAWNEFSRETFLTSRQTLETRTEAWGVLIDRK